MAKYRVLFDIKKTGTLVFDADNESDAIEIYEQLLSGETYPDDLLDSYEEIDDSDVTWFELTSNTGKVLAN
jgi:hypothetical protein